MTDSLRHLLLLAATLLTLSGVYLTFVRALRRDGSRNYALGSGRVFDAFTTDRGVWLFVGVALAAVADRVLGHPVFPSAVRDAGLLAYVACCLMLVWTDSMLAHHFNHYDEREPALMTRGPYALVRHPRYLCWIGLLASLSVALGSAVGLLGTAGFTAVVVRRVTLEDRFLVDLYGDRYRSYARSRARLLPLVW